MPNEQKEERNNLVEELKQTLDDYLAMRAERFSVKDKLSSADKTAREEFINELKTELDSFAESGDSKDVIRLLKYAIPMLPGLHLQTTLHQITLRLIDDTPTDPIPLNEWMNKKVEPEHQKYHQAMRELFFKAQALERFGDTLSNSDERRAVKTLALQLSQDINYLQSQHPGKQVPSKEDFERFQTKFNARLHSQDVVMSKHENWKSLVLNVVLAVVTLGIALGVKAAYSKATEGRVTFFSAETEKETQIKDLDKGLENIAQHVPKGGV